MKIEKISDSQIRCTLNYSDLHDRSISLRELAYGSARARELFHEMIQRASEEVGFYPEDTPLMVEAIPLSNDGIILNISKIEDPDEIDTRFSRFAPHIEEAGSEKEAPARHAATENLLESLKSLLGDPQDPASGETANTEATAAGEAAAGEPRTSRDSSASLSIYRFRRLDSVIRAAVLLKGVYRGDNSLYLDPADGTYYLVLHRSEHTPEEFNKVCNILTEYGMKIRVPAASEYYYKEHLTKMVLHQALQSLAV